jgi:hypothetical protein
MNKTFALILASPQKSVTDAGHGSGEVRKGVYAGGGREYEGLRLLLM